MSVCRNTPTKVQRQLRREAHFGCCRCGLPVLDNAHIIPFSITHAFPPEDMLALCPSCHRIAHEGDYSEKYMREMKANPHNKLHVSERFLIEGNDLVLNIASNKFVNCPTVLTVNDFDIITMKKELGGDITMNLSLFDKNNKLIGIIDENKWTFDTSVVWDLEYKAKHLKIRNARRKISFEIKIEKGEVFLNGNMYYLGTPLIISNEKVQIGNNSLFSNMKGCVFSNLNTAIRYQINRVF